MAPALCAAALPRARRCASGCPGCRRRRNPVRTLSPRSPREDHDYSMTVEATGLRTHMCGALRATHAGAHVRLGGWVHRTRNLGGLVFVDLRDRAGIIQVSFDPNRTPPEAVAVAGSLGNETVMLVEG